MPPNTACLQAHARPLQTPSSHVAPNPHRRQRIWQAIPGPKRYTSVDAPAAAGVAIPQAGRPRATRCALSGRPPAHPADSIEPCSSMPAPSRLFPGKDRRWSGIAPYMYASSQLEDTRPQQHVQHAQPVNNPCDHARKSGRLSLRGRSSAQKQKQPLTYNCVS